MEMQARFPRIFVGYGRTGFLAKKSQNRFDRNLVF
jgi:hypothetical protein